jgi:hypothetical protein
LAIIGSEEKTMSNTAVRIINRKTEQDAERLSHVYKSGVEPEYKEEYCNIRVDEAHGCYANDFSEEASNPMFWGGGE